MIRTVDHGALHIDQGITSDHTGFAGLFHALFGGLDVFLGNNTAHDLVDELETGARLAGLHFDHDMAVLTFTTGLTGELAFTTSGATDGFPIGHLRSTDVGLHLEFPQHAVHQDFQVKLTHAGDHGLAGFLIRVDAECGVFLRQCHQGLGEFLHVALGFGLDRHRDHRFRDEQGFEDDRIVLRAEGVTRGGVLQAENGTEIAGPQSINFFAVVGLQHHQT